MKKLELPKIGLRNIKTALAVFICMILFQLFGGSNPLYACIAAVICMKDTVESSFIMGKNRLAGTLLGGLLGVIGIYIIDLIPILQAASPLIAAIGVVLAIYCCNIIDKPGAVTICCIVFIGIIINYDGPSSYSYAIGRSIDTSIGIIVAILINKYINPPEECIIEEHTILDETDTEEVTKQDNEATKTSV